MLSEGVVIRKMFIGDPSAVRVNIYSKFHIRTKFDTNKNNYLKASRILNEPRKVTLDGGSRAIVKLIKTITQSTWTFDLNLLSNHVSATVPQVFVWRTNSVESSCKFLWRGSQKPQSLFSSPLSVYVWLKLFLINQNVKNLKTDKKFVSLFLLINFLWLHRMHHRHAISFEVNFFWCNLRYQTGTSNVSKECHFFSTNFVDTNYPMPKLSGTFLIKCLFNYLFWKSNRIGRKVFLPRRLNRKAKNEKWNKRKKLWSRNRSSDDGEWFRSTSFELIYA